MKTKFSTIASFLFFLCVPILTLASEEGTTHEEHAHGFETIIPYWAHFIVFVVILYALLKKPLKNVWNERRIRIENAVLAGERALEQAELRVTESLRRLSSVESDIRAMDANMEAETGREAKNIVKASQEKVKRIAEQTQEFISAEERGAEMNLQKEIADSIIEKATEILRGKISLAEDAGRRSAVIKGYSKNG